MFAHEFCLKNFWRPNSDISRPVGLLGNDSGLPTRVKTTSDMLEYFAVENERRGGGAQESVVVFVAVLSEPFGAERVIS